MKVSLIIKYSTDNLILMNPLLSSSEAKYKVFCDTFLYLMNDIQGTDPLVN